MDQTTIDTDINQKITFKADHTWTENQHNVDNIYSGTWSISGDHSIYLEPYGETIEINPDNLKENERRPLSSPADAKKNN